MTRNEVLALAVLAAVVCTAFPWARRAAWAVLRGTVGGLLALAALPVERRRHRRQPTPTTAPTPCDPDVRPQTRPQARPGWQPPPPVPRRWRVRLSTRVDGFLVTVADGEVVGPWTTAAQVRAETLARLAEATGAPTERVYAEAWPVTDQNRTAA